MKKTLFVEISGFKPLPGRATLEVAAAGSELISVTSLEAALSILSVLPRIDIMVCNSPNYRLFTACQEKGGVTTVLVTSLPMGEYSHTLHGREVNLVDFVIANRYPASWTVREFNTTLQKVLRQDFMGIEKYLLPGTAIASCEITGSHCRESINREVQAFAIENKINSYIAKIIFGISEELLMNAIYDAPAAAGATERMESDRFKSFMLAPHEQGMLRYGCDGNVFAVSASDPFGKLERETFRRYLKKIIDRKDSNKLIDTKKGGAGLGLFKILFGAHALVCNVKKDKITEVIAIIDNTEQVRDFSKMARSLHFFQA